VPGRVAREEQIVLDRAAQLVGYPVALIALRGQAQIVREPDGRLLDVMGGPERAHADAELIRGREAPPVSGPDVGRVDPQLHLIARAGRVDLQAAREAGLGRLDGGGVGERASPAEGVDDQRGAQLAAVGRDREALPSGDGCGLELDLRGVGLRPQQGAQLAVVERGEGPRQLPASGPKGRVHDELVEALAQRVHQIERLQPQRGDPAGRGLALADLIAVDHEHPRAAAGELPRDRQSREARPADEHVAIALQAGALLSPLRRSNRHVPGNDTAALRFGRCKH
jgi:hypothetical protein